MKISDKFKKLSFKDKLDYIWDYYKIPLMGAVTLVVLIIYILYLIFRHVPEEVLDVTLMNSMVVSEEKITIDDDYLDFAGYNPEEYQVSMGVHITIERDMSGKARELVAAMILAEEIDVLCWDNEAYDYVKNLDANADLENYFSESYIDKYKKYAIYENDILIGFKFNGTEEITQELLMNESYFGIVETSQKKDEAVRFIEFLLDVNYGSEN